MVTTSYPRFAGDTIGTFMEPIARGLADRGHQVHMVLPWHPRWERAPVEHGVHFHPFRYAPGRALNVFGYAGALKEDVRLRRSAWIGRAARPRGRAAGRQHRHPPRAGDGGPRPLGRARRRDRRRGGRTASARCQPPRLRRLRRGAPWHGTGGRARRLQAGGVGDGVQRRSARTGHRARGAARSGGDAAVRRRRRPVRAGSRWPARPCVASSVSAQMIRCCSPQAASSARRASSS